MAFVPDTTVEIRSQTRCVIRSGTPTEAASVLECAREVFATSQHTLTQADEFSLTVEQERDFIQEKLSSEDELFLIAIDPDGRAAGGDANGGEHAGDASASPGPHVIGILDLKHPAKRRKVRHIALMGISVRSTYRGRGVGEALLREAIRWAEACPTLELMTLEVYAANAAGFNLYRKLGFVEYGRLPDGCKHDDGSGWEQVMMVRRLKR